VSGVSVSDISSSGAVMTATLSVLLPDIKLTPDTYDFGEITSGLSLPYATFTVSNIGTAELVIGSATLSGSNASDFRIQRDDCSMKKLAPSADCMLEIGFVPAGLGYKRASINVPSNDPDTPVGYIILSGTVVAPDIRIYPDSKDFGRVRLGETSEPASFSIGNIGTGNLIIHEIGISGSGAQDFHIQRNDCSGGNLSPRKTCTLELVFTPVSEDFRSGTLDILSSDPDTPEIHIPLSGIGTAGETEKPKNGCGCVLVKTTERANNYYGFILLVAVVLLGIRLIRN